MSRPTITYLYKKTVFARLIKLLINGYRYAGHRHNYIPIGLGDYVEANSCTCVNERVIAQSKEII